MKFVDLLNKELNENLLTNVINTAKNITANIMTTFKDPNKKFKDDKEVIEALKMVYNKMQNPTKFNGLVAQTLNALKLEMQAQKISGQKPIATTSSTNNMTTSGGL